MYYSESACFPPNPVLIPKESNFQGGGTSNTGKTPDISPEILSVNQVEGIISDLFTKGDASVSVQF